MIAPHAERRRQADVVASLLPLRFVHTTLDPEEIPERPEMSDLELAIRGKLERNEALDVQERTHLMKLWRETSKLKAPLIVELLKGDLEGVEKVVVFAIFRETIDIICKGLATSPRRSMAYTANATVRG